MSVNKKYLHEIEAIFDEKEAREQALQKKEKEKKDEEERRLQTFFYKRETVYKPLFENVKKTVESNGMGCFIENEKEEDGFSSPQIKITFFEKDGENRPLSGETAGFAVAFDKINNQIIIYESNFFGKAKENAARYDVEGVTEDFLSLRIVKLLKEIVLR